MIRGSGFLSQGDSPTFPARSLLPIPTSGGQAPEEPGVHSSLSTSDRLSLQSQLLAKTHTLHSHAIGPSSAADPAYADGAWTPEQRETMLVDVKAIGYGSVVLVGVNAFLVAWVTALRGGRLDVLRRRTSRRPEAEPTPR